MTAGGGEEGSGLREGDGDGSGCRDQGWNFAFRFVCNRVVLLVVEYCLKFLCLCILNQEVIERGREDSHDLGCIYIKIYRQKQLSLLDCHILTLVLRPKLERVCVCMPASLPARLLRLRAYSRIELLAFALAASQAERAITEHSANGK